MKTVLAISAFLLLLGSVLTACSVSEPTLRPNSETRVLEGTVSIETTEVSWAEALEILNTGEVKLVSQSHNLRVSLVLIDGRTITTVQPNIDAIFNAITECGEACSDVIMVSE